MMFKTLKMKALPKTRALVRFGTLSALLLSQTALADFVVDSQSFGAIPIQDRGASGVQPGNPGSPGTGVGAIGQALEFTGKDGKRYRVVIKDIRPISGNNPLNPRQPVRNFNGTEVETNTQLVQLVENGSTGAGTGAGAGGGNTLANCVRTVSMNTVLAPPNPIFGANFEIDPATLKCLTPPPGVLGAGNFSITEATGDAANTAIFIGSSGAGAGDWVLDGGGTVQLYTTNSVVTVIARSNTARRLQIQFRVTPGSPATLQIISLTEL